MRNNSDKNCCSLCYQTLRNQFHLYKFGFNYERPTAFCTSQWQHGKRSILWLIYRWLLAIFFTAGVICTMILYFDGGRWFIYLTNWGLLLCMFTCTFGAVVTTIYYINPNYFAPNTLALKIYWCSHFSTLALAILITLVYWIFLYGDDPIAQSSMFNNIANICAHACNTLLMLLDFMLVAFPIHLLHYIYVLGIGFTFSIFSLIYYLAGGTDIFGNDFIYPILDWSKPGQAIGTICATYVTMAIFTFLLFWLYQLRRWLYRKYRKSEQLQIV